MRLVELTCTCEASPTQWDGRLEDGRAVYIRYRHARLSVEIGPPHGRYPFDSDEWVVLFEQEGVAEPQGRHFPIETVCALTGLTLDPDAGPYLPRP